MHTTRTARTATTPARRSTTTASSNSSAATRSAIFLESTRISSSARRRTASGSCWSCMAHSARRTAGEANSCPTKRRPTSGCSAPPTSRCRKPTPCGEAAAMARRRKKRTLRPRLPARIKKKSRKKKAQADQHPELMGLGLVALGIFLASVLYLGWNGGSVGGWVADAFRAVIGAGAYVAPVAFATVGMLMVGRSELVDVRPFRTGLIVSAFGLLTTLGASSGGAIGRGLGKLLGLLLGTTGTTILGVFALVVGLLLLSGASIGALMRRSGQAVRRAHSRARRARTGQPLTEPAPVIP